MIGQTISHYKILEKLGGGGMGVVYKAEDTKLKRTVALKFLPPELTADSKAKERFLHEAQAASSLDHPNICDVHDIAETDDGQTFIVMSFYDGETLKKKIAGSRLKIEQAVEIAAQIAEGLAKAHEHGIVHRDIKPANVLVTKEGTVKILDFGLAKLTGETRLTKTGSTVGTLAYMSPEQMQGSEVDARTDIWSLGAVLYEMLSGAAPFRGEHEGALLYEIMTADPTPISELVSEADPELQQLVSKCLEKDREERYQAVKDVMVDCRRIKREMKAMRQLSATYSHSIRPDSTSVARGFAKAKVSKDRGRWIWVAISAVLFCITVLLAVREYVGRGSEEEVVFQAAVLPPENGRFRFTGAHAGPITLSPDGRRIAYLASGRDGKELLWVRRAEETVARPLSNTEGASYPFWAPNGQSIGYFSAGKLKRVDVESGKVNEICNASYGLGGSWNNDGIIIFAPSSSEPIFKVSANGGTAVPVTQVDAAKKEIYHQYPYFLPDGNHFLFLARSRSTNVRPTADEVCVSSLDGTERKSILQGGADKCRLFERLLDISEISHIDGNSI